VIELKLAGFEQLSEFRHCAVLFISALAVLEEDPSCIVVHEEYDFYLVSFIVKVDAARDDLCDQFAG